MPLPEDGKNLPGIGDGMPVDRLASDRDQRWRRWVLHVAVEAFDGRDEWDVVEGDDRHRFWNDGKIPREPRELEAVDVAVIPLVLDVGCIEADEVHATVVER